MRPDDRKPDANRNSPGLKCHKRLNHPAKDSKFWGLELAGFASLGMHGEVTPEAQFCRVAQADLPGPKLPAVPPGEV